MQHVMLLLQAFEVWNIVTEIATMLVVLFTIKAAIINEFIEAMDQITE